MALSWPVAADLAVVVAMGQTRIAQAAGVHDAADDARPIPGMN